jgi:phospholipid/cholesterol/gamma-HCH transport system permease protein
MDKLTAILEPVGNLGRMLIETVLMFGRWCFFVGDTVYWMFRPPVRWTNFFKQMEFIGVKSISIIALTVFLRGVFALQTGKAFSMFNAEIMIGATMG